MPTHIPRNIETTKIIKGYGAQKNKAILGPGHNPHTPQPTPKRAEPLKSFRSISFFKGRKN